jgi:hypothetical protein
MTFRVPFVVYKFNFKKFVVCKLKFNSGDGLNKKNIPIKIFFFLKKKKKF